MAAIDEQQQGHPNKPSIGRQTESAQTETGSGNNPFSPWMQMGQVPEHMERHGSPQTYQTASEYASALRLWLQQYQSYQSMANFYMTMPMYMMGLAAAQHASRGFGQAPAGSNQGVTANAAPPVQRPRQTPANRQAQPGAHQAQHVSEYSIPPLWKRLLAEFIDFFILFVIKLGVTILLVEYNIIDIELFDKYDFDNIFKHNFDYSTAFNVTSELVAIEVVNRILITIFEALCLRQGINTIGGTTPGKKAVGLKVVSCQRIIMLDNHRVQVIPAEDLGFLLAFLRSLLKNFSMAFFFPASFTVFVFEHNRALYDVVAGCVVVQQARVPRHQVPRPARQ